MCNANRWYLQQIIISNSGTISFSTLSRALDAHEANGRAILLQQPDISVGLAFSIDPFQDSRPVSDLRVQQPSDCARLANRNDVLVEAFRERVWERDGILRSPVRCVDALAQKVEL